LYLKADNSIKRPAAGLLADELWEIDLAQTAS
jgi:hypothetical protein